MKYGFYVSGNATRLKLYLKTLKEKEEQHEVSFVLIDNINNTELQKLCEQNKVPFHEYSYNELNLKGKSQNEFISNKLLELLDESSAKYCFVFGSRILQGNLLEKYSNNLINFHPSLLPSYKGINAIDQALQNNALLLGNTAHFINKEMDDGAIIMQSILPTSEFHGYDSLMNMQIPMLKQIIDWLRADRISIDNNEKVVIKDALYKLDSFIPNLESI